MVGLPEDWSYEMPLSQEVISDTLALSGPHVNRTLAKLRGDGLIKVSNHSVCLADPVALEMLGHFHPHLTPVPAPVANASHDRRRRLDRYGAHAQAIDETPKWPCSNVGSLCTASAVSVSTMWPLLMM
jgi:DNA-binding transcriptional regulator LsrR (DeoR family)